MFLSLVVNTLVKECFRNPFLYMTPVQSAKRKLELWFCSWTSPHLNDPVFSIVISDHSESHEQEYDEVLESWGYFKTDFS